MYSKAFLLASSGLGLLGTCSCFHGALVCVTGCAQLLKCFDENAFVLKKLYKYGRVDQGVASSGYCQCQLSSKAQVREKMETEVIPQFSDPKAQMASSFQISLLGFLCLTVRGNPTSVQNYETLLLNIRTRVLVEMHQQRSRNSGGLANFVRRSVWRASPRGGGCG